MLNRAQCSRADDQRGLLTKEQLVLPQFLQLPAEQKDEESPEEEPEDSSNHTCSPGSPGEQGKRSTNGVNKEPSEEKTVKDCENNNIGSNNGTLL